MICEHLKARQVKISLKNLFSIGCGSFQLSFSSICQVSANLVRPNPECQAIRKSLFDFLSERFGPAIIKCCRSYTQREIVAVVVQGLVHCVLAAITQVRILVTAYLLLPICIQHCKHTATKRVWTDKVSLDLTKDSSYQYLTSSYCSLQE